MERNAGSLSPDGHWYWDGQDWLAALSPDGHWRWDGARWVREVRLQSMTWVPPWDRNDKLRLVVAALVIPVMLTALVAVLLWTCTDEPGVWGAAAVIGLAGCGTGVGFIVRARAGWPEVFVLALTIATAIAVFSGVAGVVTTGMTNGCSQQSTASKYKSECDTTGYGIGAAVIGSSCFVVLVPFTLAGKAIARRRHRTETVH